VVMLAITSRDARTALDDMAFFLKLPVNPLPAGMNLYERERSLLADFRLVPLFHMPEAWALSGRVRNWPRLADVWLDQGTKP